MTPARHKPVGVCRSGVLALILLGGHTAPLWAQWSLDVGATSVKYDELDARTGAVLSPGYRQGWGRTFVDLAASGAAFEDGAWSTELQGLIAVRPKISPAGRLELLAGAGMTRARLSTSTSQEWLRARWHLRSSGPDAWVGIGGGGVSSTTLTRSILTAESGASWNEGRWQFLALGGVTQLGAEGRYAEAAGTVRRAGRVELSLSVGGRQQWRPLVEDVAWVSGSAEMPLRRIGSLVLSAGNYPADLAQEFASGRYLSLTLRVGAGRTGGTTPPRATRPAPSSTASGGSRFAVRRLPDGSIRISVRAPRAASVEIAGDFSDWMPLPLRREGETWTITLPLAAGVHPTGLRIDGGEWRAPPGTAHVQDDFGGEVGLLVVE